MKIRYYFFIIVCIMMYSLPIYGVIKISQKEVDSYSEDIHFEFDEVSYGEPIKLERRNIREYYLVNGTVTCRNIYMINVNSNATVKCEIGNEVHSGDVLAVYGYNEVKAEFDGVIVDIDYGDSISISYYDFSDLVFEVLLDQDKRSVVENKKFESESGDNIRLIEKSNIIENGKFKIALEMPKDVDKAYGLQLNDYKLYTGVKYSGVLVANKDCVYKKGDQYYVRVVDEDGHYISEEQVKIGLVFEDYICISSENIDEDTYCDSGYAVVNDDDTNELGENINGDTSE